MTHTSSRPLLGAIRYLLSLMAGALVTLGFSPYDVWPVPMLAIGTIFLLTRTLPVKAAVRCGLLFGVGMFGTGTSWIYVSIHEFGAAAPPLAALLTGLFVLFIAALMVVPVFALYGWLNQRFAHRRWRPWQQAVLFSALWVLFEWARSWLLTGFPWLLFGYTLIDTPFAALAPLTGVYGLSLLMVTTACLLFALVIPTRQRTSRTGNVVALAVSIACWGLSWSLDAIEWTRKSSELSFSAVQGNIPQELKWDPEFFLSTVNTYINLSEDFWQQQLIIWPENAIPLLYTQVPDLLAHLDAQASQQGSTLIFGMPVDEYDSGKVFYHNSIVAVGQGRGRYDKQKLVPFGEYLPIQWLRGLIGFFDLPMSDFSAGDSGQTLLEAGNVHIAPYICYEVVYPDFAAGLARQSGLLITISNDTWFGKSIGPVQHFQMARMRALENGRQMIRATNDGITALIDQKGDVIATIPRFSSGVLSANAEVREGQTPFMRFGSWPVILLSLLMVVAVLLPGRHARK